MHELLIYIFIIYFIDLALGDEVSLPAKVLIGSLGILLIISIVWVIEDLLLK